MKRAHQIERLRLAADTIRAEWNGDKGSAWLPVQQFHLAVADWLDAEVSTQSTMEPLVNLVSVAIEKGGGPVGYLKIGHTEDGEIAMHSDVMPSAFRAAEAYLAGAK